MDNGASYGSAVPQSIVQRALSDTDETAAVEGSEAGRRENDDGGRGSGFYTLHVFSLD